MSYTQAKPAKHLVGSSKTSQPAGAPSHSAQTKRSNSNGLSGSTYGGQTGSSKKK